MLRRGGFFVKSAHVVRPGRVAGFFLLAPLALTACGQGGPAAGGGGGFQMPPMPVETAEATRSGVKDQLTAVGSIEAGEMITVTSELDGIVESLPFAEGTPLAKGVTLARLDDRELKAALAREEAILVQNRQNFDRARTLNEQGAISQATLEAAEASLKVAEANVAYSRTRLEKSVVTAPFRGLVGARRVSPGAYVRAGDPITDLSQVDEIKVTFAAPERYLGQLVRGAPVAVTAPAFPGTTLTGHIDVIEPILDPTTRNARIIARVPNPDMLFRPGMSANVAVVLSERPEALTIPSEAVFVEGDQAFVFVVNADSSVARSPVTLGTRTASAVEVIEGLGPGSKIVTAGHQKLFPGAKVMPMPPGGGAPPAPGAAPDAPAEAEGGHS
jgi:membrane fusion protein (multidrug efflux system)